jgi:hypothetical protein
MNDAIATFPLVRLPELAARGATRAPDQSAATDSLSSPDWKNRTAPFSMEVLDASFAKRLVTSLKERIKSRPTAFPARLDGAWRCAAPGRTLLS